MCGQFLGRLGKIGSRGDLEREPRQRVGWPRLKRNRLQPLLACQKGPFGVTLEQREADDLRVVCDLALQIGRRQRGMAESAHLYHRAAPDRTLARANAPARVER